MLSRFMSKFMCGAALAAAAALQAEEPSWIPGTGEVPALAVYAGSEQGNSYYVCRGEYMGGLHPGKLHAGKCNIEFALGEIVLETYEVLLEEADYVRWVPDSMGAAPPDAFPVGSEDGGTLYSCAAEVQQHDPSTGEVMGSLGIHAGKIKSNNCHVPYGGGAYLTERYAVLVILTPTEIRRAVPRALAAKPGTARYDLMGRKLGWRKVSAGTFSVPGLAR